MNEKERIDEITSSFVRNWCTPKVSEQEMAEEEYDILRSILEGRTFKSGSYVRLTSTTPLGDLDVLWVISSELRKSISAGELDMNNLLVDLAKRIEDEYGARGEKVEAIPQPHSIMIDFVDREHGFTIDVVPAKKIFEETNEFGKHLYYIPEVGLMSHFRKQAFYAELAEGTPIDWIKTDPKGYRDAAIQTNKKSRTFRKATKLIKKWLNSHKNRADLCKYKFKLNSFHLENIVRNLVELKPTITILELVREIMSKMEFYLTAPHFPDRAQEAGKPLRNIDDYVKTLTLEDKKRILIASKSAITILDWIVDGISEDGIVEILHRFTAGEEDICAYGFTRDLDAIRQNKGRLIADGNLDQVPNGFPEGSLKKGRALKKGLWGLLGKGFNIIFQAKAADSQLTEYWKIRNTGEVALAKGALRGEITKGQTMNKKEITEYKGTHYACCYWVDENTQKIVGEDTIVVPINY